MSQTSTQAPGPLLPAHLVLDGHWLELALLQDLCEASTTLERVLGGGVQIGAKLREGSHLTELCQLQLQRTRHLQRVRTSRQ